VIVALVGGFIGFTDRARRQADLLLRWVELENLERKNLPDFDRIFGFLDAIVAQL
jgi:hypothetical protein